MKKSIFEKKKYINLNSKIPRNLFKVLNKDSFKIAKKNFLDLE